MNRRHACSLLASSALASSLRAAPPKLTLNYVLSSALYGNIELETVLPEIARTGSVGLDLWGKPHSTQREEVDAMGVDAFADVLRKHDAELVVSSRYPLGCFGLQSEMLVLKELGGKILVCATTKPREPSGAEAKKAVAEFLEKMKPHADAAAEHGLVIALENHANQLLYHPDSIRYFEEFNDHPALGICFAPHHLHLFVEEIPKLIRDLGDGRIPFIYFQEYGIGSKKTVAKEVELEQLPGRGSLDYRPIVAALRDIKFTGVASIFMHPTPRGLPMLPTAGEITKVINESRAYIDDCLAA